MGYETVVRKSIFNLILGVRVGLRQFKEGVVYGDGKSATPPPHHPQNLVLTRPGPARALRRDGRPRREAKRCAREIIGF